ncbi:hypothetical protein EV130_101472 [Rhizobium azibense]|uniref:Uncharacterized protein n=1 Tax=Rhizobium azibense TaxID=1136135 RepID=A0A4R3R9P7_9HYPH|nr:hypothetical protein EV130_101472 [Rhizobium azibense]
MGLRGIPRPGTRRLDSGEGQANGKHRVAKAHDLANTKWD